MKRSYLEQTGAASALRKGYSKAPKKAKMTRKPTQAAMAAAAAAAATKGEFKFKDTTVSVGLNTTPSFTPINLTASGAGVDQHQGREIVMKSVQINLVATATPTTGLSQIARVMLVYDRQTNAGTPTITDILTSNSVTAPRNLNNRHRFKIMWDQLVVLPERITATQSGPLEVPLRYYRKLRHPVEYNETATATIDAINTGSLILVTTAEIASGTTDGTLDGQARIRFWDM